MDIKDLPETSSLLDDIENFLENPKFSPKNQNKWFFSDGMSYYEQLIEINKVLDLFKQAFSSVYSNEKTIADGYSSLSTLPEQVQNIQTEMDTFTEKYKDVPNQIISLQTRVTTLESETQSAISRITANETAIKEINAKDFLTQVKFLDSANITFVDNGKKDGIQSFTGIVTGSVPANLTQNLSYANASVTNLMIGMGTNIVDDSGTTIALINESKVITNGNLTTVQYTLGNLSKDYFIKDSDGNVSLDPSKFDLSEYAKKTDLETKANQTDLDVTNANLAKLSSGQEMANNTNLDEITGNGFYHCNGLWSGTLPDITGYDWTNSNVLAFNCGSDAVVQVIFNYTTNCYCVRTGKGTPPTWTNWSVCATSTQELGENFTTTIQAINKTIGTNTANITTNASNIATNTANITTNASEIASVKGGTMVIDGTTVTFTVTES